MNTKKDHIALGGDGKRKDRLLAWRNHIDGRPMLHIASTSGARASCALSKDDGLWLATWLIRQATDAPRKNQPLPHVTINVEGFIGDRAELARELKELTKTPDPDEAA